MCDGDVTLQLSDPISLRAVTFHERDSISDMMGSRKNRGFRGNQRRSALPDGYCYMRLFEDVLGNKFNFKETKRVFGRYPRLRVVLSQLMRLADGDCFVHDVVYVGTTTTHVADYPIVRLSTLIENFMFTDRVIGGERSDAATDAATLRSTQSRTLANWAMSSGRDLKDLIETVGNTLVKKDIQSDSSVMRELLSD